MPTPAELRVIPGAGTDALGPPVILDPKDPYPGACEFLHRHFRHDDLPTLYEQAGEFFEYQGTHYVRVEDSSLRARLWHYAAAAKRWDKNGDAIDYQPNTNKIANLLEAVRAQAHLPASSAAPCWLDRRPGDPDPAELVPMTNGLLHVPTRDLLALTPRLFSQHALEFAYQESGPEPESWLGFLQDLWPDDPQAIQVLREIMGYLLLPDTRQQKAFLLVGPKRSGKGTIGRVITTLLGRANVCAPTLNSMAGPFGQQPLIGKMLALISDARLSGRADQAAIAERILTVTGEDSVTVDRKHLPSWTGRLPTRFLILTNELPRLTDASGALASRFIVLTLEKSFFGAEDPLLSERLLAELPGIFRWALDGWDSLTERGHFVQPTSSAEAVQEMEDLGSPISAFLRERCRVGSGQTVECARLYEAWKAWCQVEGRDHPGTSHTFGRDLRASIPGLRTSSLRIGGGRQRFYEGIGLC